VHQQGWGLVSQYCSLLGDFLKKILSKIIDLKTPNAINNHMAKNRNFTLEEQLQIVADYNIIKSAEKLSPKYKVSANCIRNVLHKHNVEVNGGRVNKYLFLEDAIQEYLTGELLNVVTTKYKFDKKYFKKVLESRSIEIVDLPKSVILTKKHLNLYNNYEKALELYNKRKRIKDVLDFFELKHVSSFYGVMRLRGIKIPKSNENSKLLKKDEKKTEEILKQYENMVPIEKLKDIYNVSARAIMEILKSKNANLRPKSLANQIKNMNEDFQRHCIKRSYRSKKYILPSGLDITVQGYEDHFLDFIFSNKILDESDFEFKVPYVIYSENPEKKYYPDFYIPKYNLIVEIKSAYTLSRTDPRKKEATEKLYKYIVIVDKNYTDFLLFLQNNK
jgi:hypothetical protein